MADALRADLVGHGRTGFADGTVDPKASTPARIGPHAGSQTDRLLRLLAVAVVVLPALVFAGVAWTAYGAAFAQARARLNGTLDIAYEHAVKVFETHDLVAAQVNQILLGLTDAEIAARGSALHDRLAKLARPLPQVAGLWVLDRDGRVLLTSTDYPVDRAPDLSDRPYFRAHRDGLVPAGSDFVGEVITGRLVNSVVFQVSVAREAPSAADGFAGVVAVSAKPDYLHGVYAEMVAAGGISTLGLLRADSTLLARYPAAGLGRKIAGPVGRAIADRPERGLVEGPSSTDGVERLFAYRRLPHHGVYVVAGLDRSAVVASWVRGMAVHLLFGVPATAAMLSLCLLALRRTRREALALAALRAEAARREETEGQLRQAHKMEAVGQLTGGIAHDFNNLLAGITGALELMEARIAAGRLGEVARYAGIARDATRRAAALTHRLLAFSRRQALDPKPTDVARLVAGMEDLVRRTIGSSVRLDVVPAPGSWATLVDPNQLENALLNLCINARDAMPDGGRITVDTFNTRLSDRTARDQGMEPGPYVRLDVTDTGTGMPPEVAARVFEPFFTTKPVGVGTGLGLSMVHGFARQSGGQVRIRSLVGMGTTISLYLPRYRGATDDPEAAPALAGPLPA